MHSKRYQCHFISIEYWITLGTCERKSFLLNFKGDANLKKKCLQKSSRKLKSRRKKKNFYVLGRNFSLTTFISIMSTLIWLSCFRYQKRLGRYKAVFLVMPASATDAPLTINQLKENGRCYIDSNMKMVEVVCMVVKSCCDFSITLPPCSSSSFSLSLSDSLEIMAILLDVKLNCSFYSHIIKSISWEIFNQLNYFIYLLSSP